MSTSIKQRFIWADNLRALLIYLVVLGHCIQYTDAGYQENFLFYLIYSFHMPLFMFVSGFVSWKEDVTLRVIGRRFMQLLVPFFVYTLLAAIIKWDINIFFSTVLRPERGLWFLWALFFIVLFRTIACLIARHLNIRPVFVDIVLFVALCVGGHFFDRFCLPTIAKFYLFYTLGSYARKYEDIVYNKKYIIIILIVSFLVWVSFVVVGFRDATGIGDNTIFKWLLSIVGIMAFTSLFKMSEFNNKLILAVGRGTLGIYAIHWYLLWFMRIKPILFGNDLLYYFFLIVMSVALLTVSFLLVSLLRKNRITRCLFLGERAKQ